MAFFNFRRSGANPAAAGPAAQPESVEAIRKRAKHRLIGAVVLVLLGVVGFPLLFDTQPRPIAVDIPIEIPGKNAVKPLSLPEPAAATGTAVAPAIPAVAPVTTAPAAKPAAADKVSAGSSLSPQEEIVPSKPVNSPEAPAQDAGKTDAKAAHKTEAKAVPVAKPTVKAETKPASKPVATDDDGARARALLNGTAQTAKAPSTAAVTEGSARVVVQVGAFADAAKANEARTKLERAGLKTYTQVAETKDGKRTRVRVGPFGSKAEAEQAVEKIKSLGLPAAVLTL